MRIGLLGVGNIGTTLARRLAEAGHELKVANSRGPETVPAGALATGARAVHAHEVAEGVDVLITSIPFARTADLRPLLEQLPPDAVVIDTSNYYPHRDGAVTAVDEGQVESVWVGEQLGRPVVKAWNAIGSGSFDARATVAGDPERIALPVAGDDESQRAVAMTLMDQTGFDAFDAGGLEDSWRQQPGTPVYCTDLTAREVGTALAAADRARSPRRRDLAIHVIGELLDDPTPLRTDDHLVRMNRVLFV